MTIPVIEAAIEIALADHGNLSKSAKKLLEESRLGFRVITFKGKKSVQAFHETHGVWLPEGGRCLRCAAEAGEGRAIKVLRR
jgi:hypothetical protein